MIIEMIGSPGSGKTYLSNKIVKSLNNQNKFAINVIDAQRSKLSIKVLLYVYKKIIKLSFTYKKELKKMREIFKDYENKDSNFIKVNLNDYIERITFFNILYNKLNSSSKIYIFDEGILQTLSTMSVYFDIEESLCKENLKYILPQNINVVYIQASSEVVIESIKKRNRHVCAMDELDGETLENFLVKYINYCKYITQFSNCLKIYRDDDIEDNIKKIIFTIENNINYEGNSNL